MRNDGSCVQCAWSTAWRPPERRPIYLFANEHMSFGSESPYQGRFRVENSPFAQAPFDWLRDDEIDIIDLHGPAQTVKTTLGLLFAVDCICNNPGAFTWNSPTKDAAGKVAEKKAWPLFRRCQPILDRLPADPKAWRKLSVLFPDAPFHIQTASEGNAHGDTVKYQVNDDLQMWVQGMKDKFEKRTSAFTGTGRKILNLSTGSLKTHEEKLPDGTLVERGDDAFESWMKGTQSLFNVRCPEPECHELQPLVWQHRQPDGKPLLDPKGKPVYGIVWDENPTTRPNGRWNWQEVKKTARWRCRNPRCGFELADTRANIRALSCLENGACYIDTNPLPEPNRKSGRYPAMACELISWGQLVVEYLFALDCLAAGNVKPLQEFVMNRLAEAWFAGTSTETDTKATGDYRTGDVWRDAQGKPREVRRFLVLDQQQAGGKHFKALCRDFDVATGESRFVGYWPRLENEAEIQALQRDLGITNNGRVLLDVGDGTAAIENYSMVARNNWTGLKGSDAEGFQHPDPRGTGKRIIKAFSRPFYGDPSLGKKGKKKASRARRKLRKPGTALCYHWSNPTFKDMLAILRGGLGLYWGRPTDEPQEYTDGLHTEHKVMEQDKRTGRPKWRWVLKNPNDRNNHPWDLECMALVAALMSGLLSPPPPPTEEGHSTKDD